MEVDSLGSQGKVARCGEADLAVAVQSSRGIGLQHLKRGLLPGGLSWKEEENDDDDMVIE